MPSSPFIGESLGVGRHGFPDPRVFRDGQDFYITGTSYRYFFQTSSFQQNDLKRYDFELDFGGEKGRVKKIWSLFFYRHSDGSYHAYATLNYGKFNTSVAHFVPQPGNVWSNHSPVTRWKLNRVLVHDAYDAIAIRNEDGLLYLVYDGSPKPNDNRHIMAWRMLDPETLDQSFKPRAILSPEGFRSEDRNGRDGGQLVEAATISRIQGKYVMFYSVGDFAAGNYKLGVAFSDTLIPADGQKYQKLFAPDPQNIWGSNRRKEILYLLQSQKAAWPNYYATHLHAPGSGNFVEIDEKHLLVFHARPLGLMMRPRCTWTTPIQINIQPNIPPEQWIRIP